MKRGAPGDPESTGQTLTLNATNDWSGSFTGLDKYTSRYDNDEYEYSIAENPVDSYETEIVGDAGSGYTITNTLAGTREITVTKEWKDGNGAKSQRSTFFPRGVGIVLKDKNTGDEVADQKNFLKKIQKIA